MADVYALNQVPPGGETTRDLYMAWDLGRKMLDAGWTVWGSSDGTSFSTSGTDYWTTYANSNLPGAWLALINPDGLRGFCFQCATTGAYNITFGRVWTYTQTGWSTSGASATVAPVAVGDTSFMSRGTVATPHYNYFSAAPGDSPDRNCNVYHLIVKDAATDGSIFAVGFRNGGGSGGANLIHFWACSKIYSPWDLPVSDNYVFWKGTNPVSPSGNGWNGQVAPAFLYEPPRVYYDRQFFTKPPLDQPLSLVRIALQQMQATNVAAINLPNYFDGFGDGSNTYSGTSTLMLENVGVTVDQRIYKGIAKWVVAKNAGIGQGFQGNYEWYAISSSEGGFLWIPWDGVTTTFDSGS